MAMSVTYENVVGQLVYENRGGVESYYVPDTLGSTAALKNSSGIVTDTYDYWSYGEERTHSGPSGTQMTFIGVYGYVKDIPNQLCYVRMRFLRPEIGRWQTVDPLWPRELPYEYVYGRPVLDIDPTGLQGHCPHGGKHNCIFSRPPGYESDPAYWHCYDLPPFKPTPDPVIGGGHAKYEPGWTLWTFNYGNCCGLNRRCNKASATVDCVDKACRDHDDSIPSFWQFIVGGPHINLCKAVANCDCRTYKPGSLDFVNCSDAQWKIATQFCLMGGYLPHFPWDWFG